MNYSPNVLDFLVGRVFQGKHRGALEYSPATVDARRARAAKHGSPGDSQAIIYVLPPEVLETEGWDCHLELHHDTISILIKIPRDYLLIGIPGSHCEDDPVITAQ